MSYYDRSSRSRGDARATHHDSDDDYDHHRRYSREPEYSPEPPRSRRYDEHHYQERRRFYSREAEYSPEPPRNRHSSQRSYYEDRRYDSRQPVLFRDYYQPQGSSSDVRNERKRIAARVRAAYQMALDAVQSLQTETAAVRAEIERCSQSRGALPVDPRYNPAQSANSAAAFGGRQDQRVAAPNQLRLAPSRLLHRGFTGINQQYNDAAALAENSGPPSLQGGAPTPVTDAPAKSAWPTGLLGSRHASTITPPNRGGFGRGGPRTGVHKSMDEPPMERGFSGGIGRGGCSAAVASAPKDKENEKKEDAPAVDTAAPKKEKDDASATETAAPEEEKKDDDIPAIDMAAPKEKKDDVPATGAAAPKGGKTD